MFLLKFGMRILFRKFKRQSDVRKGNVRFSINFLHCLEVECTKEETDFCEIEKKSSQRFNKKKNRKNVNFILKMS